MKPLLQLLETVRSHPCFGSVGMILCHNGVVRATARDGRPVSGLKVHVDHRRLARIVSAQKRREGIVDVLVEIDEDRFLPVGQDVMFLVVAGDIRERVIRVLEDTLNAIKTDATVKTQFFLDEPKE